MSKRFFRFPLIIIPLILSYSCFACQSSTVNVSESVASKPISSNSTFDLQEFFINPQKTDPKINDWLEPHYVVINKSSPRKNKLFVFLSGSFGIPERQKLITQQAAKLGYDAINLRYPNSWTIGRLCGKRKNPDCHGNIREEILTGIDSSPLIEINQANSLENRLVKLLQYLDWQQYLDGDNPRWELIVIAGHSQGGGEAFLIAKEHLVAKAIAFAAPADFNRRQRNSASWLTESGKTPTDRYYGFIHLQDKGIKKVLRAWELLGLDQFGDIVIVILNKDETLNRTIITNNFI